MEAKALYGLMPDRMGLSVRNGWPDSEGRAYIYFTPEDAMRMMRCGHNKAVKLFAELDSIGLIERKKQGHTNWRHCLCLGQCRLPPQSRSSPWEPALQICSILFELKIFLQNMTLYTKNELRKYANNRIMAGALDN